MRIIVDKYLLALFGNDRQVNHRVLNYHTLQKISEMIYIQIYSHISSVVYYLYSVRSKLKIEIKMHEYMLNSIYSLNRIKIKNRQLSFKVVDIQFQDEQFCKTNINHGEFKYYCQALVPDP